MSDRLVEAVEIQAAACASSSPLYATVLHRVAEDLRAGGVTRGILAPYAEDPFGSVVPLRLLGAVHRLVLEGRAPALAAHYPSTGGVPGPDLAEVFMATLEEHRAAVAAATAQPVQTNEVGRSAALVGGFCLVAGRTGLPLRCLEVGASAGLLLNWDRFRYATPEGTFGQASSGVLIDGPWSRPPPLSPVEVVERRGCDLSPIDPTSPEGRLRLQGFLWPDQLERRARLDAALRVASDHPVRVDAADAVDWLDDLLAEPSPGVATVVHHAIVMQYLSEPRRRALVELLVAAGAAATPAAPLAWLRMEPGGEVAQVRLTLWPGGVEQQIATSGYHGEHVRWLVDVGRGAPGSRAS